MEIFNKKQLMQKKLEERKNIYNIQRHILVGKEYIPLILKQEEGWIRSINQPKRSSTKNISKIIGFLNKDSTDIGYGLYVVNEQNKRIKLIPVWINEYKNIGDVFLYGDNNKHIETVLKRYPYYLVIDRKWSTIVAFKTRKAAENFLIKNFDYDSIVSDLVRGYQIRELNATNNIDSLGNKVVMQYME